MRWVGCCCWRPIALVVNVRERHVPELIISCVNAQVAAACVLAKAVRFIAWFTHVVYMSGLWTGYVFKRVIPPIADAISLALSHIDWDHVWATFRQAFVISVSASLAAFVVTRQWVLNLAIPEQVITLPRMSNRRIRRHGRLTNVNPLVGLAS